ncbi:hypothetical protein EXIGLDRAFT_754684 [Exidia glandulosa HHB12029]|uniref:Peptidase C14 caspase domain-containing protein n=1 Tax=Exidia glandulosa HHB12029 TaxID=1314781 RepID=A0A165CQN7_EXIGL|nr:hypothetical protein EXIGLDRAFT_754684 [Exidia glandulosa HHB12029]
MDTHYGLRYRNLLNQHGYGYPFFPKPSDALPIIHIGDVGILTDDGGFEYLWNVHLPADHRRNKSKVPPEFQPLPRFRQSCDVRNLVDFERNAVVASPSVHPDLAPIETLPDGTTVFKFSTADEAGAVLVLPRGGSRVDSLKRGTYHEYAMSNTKSWYRYITRDLGRLVENGRLYLVTGTDTCSSWGVASFAKPNGAQTFTLKFVASNAPSSKGASCGTCVANFPIEYRIGATDPTKARHCVFARGFRISMHDSVPAQIPTVSSSPVSKARPKGAAVPAQTTPSRLLQASILLDAAVGPGEDGSVEMEYNGKPPLFALIVGIDVYKHRSGFDNLTGAVADADDVCDFITTTLPVDAQVSILRNEQATRTAIIGALSAMKTNDDIKRGDPILIFYAGHGAEVPAPRRWPQSMMQMLIPHNFLPSHPSTPEQRGILDVTLGRYLEQLAKAKGNNITVILDSCHSGSGTRDSSPLGVMSRGFKLPASYAIDPDVDDLKLPESYTADADAKEDTDRGNRGSHPAVGFKASGLASHVLLAACSAEESARECDGRGYFTTALFEVLRASTARQMTYSEIVTQLPLLPGQRPQCEGKHQDRLIFDGKAPSGQGVFYPVTATAEGAFNLEAGEIHGFTVGAQFDVYTSTDRNARPVSRLRATATDAISAKLTWVSGSPAQSIPQPAWAVQAKAGEFATFAVAVAAELRDALKSLIEEDDMTWDTTRAPPRRAIRLVRRSIPHELEVKIKDGHAVFIIKDKVCTAAAAAASTGKKFQLAETVPISDMDTVYAVIQSAAAFFFYLRLSNTDDNIAVHLTMFQVRQQFDKKARAFRYSPCGDGLDDERGMISLAPGPSNSLYGFNLTSGSSCDLYVWLFMFDMRTLKVDIMYNPTTARGGGALLGPGRDLTPGYGDVGGAWQFTLPPGVETDVTYCKVFISSEPVKLAHIAQHSPFNRSGVRDSGPQVALRLSHPAWSTILLPIVLTAGRV